MKKELKRRIITVIVGAVIMCMVSLVPEMVQAYASTNAVSEDAGIRAEYNGTKFLSKIPQTLKKYIHKKPFVL